MLKRGGTAVHAAFAMQMVLNIVEPQSSGIGGGTFMLHYNRQTGVVTPGVAHMLDGAHKDGGKRPWQELFDPAILTASTSRRTSPRRWTSTAASPRSLACTWWPRLSAWLMPTATSTWPTPTSWHHPTTLRGRSSPTGWPQANARAARWRQPWCSAPAATACPANSGAANSPTNNVGGEHANVDLSYGGANDALITGLRALGHTVGTGAQSSGIGTIVRRSNPQGCYYLEGGADPRREGVVLGDLYRNN